MNWPFDERGGVQNRFARWWLWRPSWISERKRKINFQDCGHLGFPIRRILAVLVDSILPISFESIGFSVQKKKNEIDFQDGSQSVHLGFPIGMNELFLIYKLSQYFLTSFEWIGLSVKEWNFIINLQDAGCGGHLGFLNRMVLTIFDLQVVPILPNKFRINNRNDLAIFDLKFAPILPTKQQVH